MARGLIWQRLWYIDVHYSYLVWAFIITMTWVKIELAVQQMPRLSMFIVKIITGCIFDEHYMLKLGYVHLTECSKLGQGLHLSAILGSPVVQSSSPAQWIQTPHYSGSVVQSSSPAQWIQTPHHSGSVSYMVKTVEGQHILTRSKTGDVPPVPDPTSKSYVCEYTRHTWTGGCQHWWW